MSLSIPPPFTAAPRRLYTEFLLDAAKSMTRDSGGLSCLKQFACLLRPLPNCAGSQTRALAAILSCLFIVTLLLDYGRGYFLFIGERGAASQRDRQGHARGKRCIGTCVAECVGVSMVLSNWVLGTRCTKHHTAISAGCGREAPLRCWQTSLSKWETLLPIIAAGSCGAAGLRSAGRSAADRGMGPPLMVDIERSS